MPSYSFPVDVVYLWVDSNDPLWQKRKQNELEKAQKTHLTIQKEALAPARFRNNNELKYSLRSLELYAPWVNQIHIITDQQCPDWLKRSSINLVDHKDILPANAAYPVYNSNLIEICMHRISSLTEHFIAFNDDVMLGAPINKADFFTKDGKTKQWLTQKAIKPFKEGLKNLDLLSLQTRNIANAHMAIAKKYGLLMPYGFKHCPRPYTKSSMEELWLAFPEKIEENLQLPFRDKKAIATFILYALYMLATQKGIKKQTNGVYSILERLCGRVSNISVDLGDDRYPSKVRRIKKQHPLTFCINDCDSPKGELRLLELQEFLQEMFPKKSKFEL